MDKLLERFETWFSAVMGLHQVAPILVDLIILVLLLVLALIVNYIAKRFILRLVEHYAQ
jgi:hypothetical protein